MHQPFVKQIGKSVHVLQQMEGAAERAQRLLSPRNEHPDGGIYELVAAARYAPVASSVGFISEGSSPTSDLRATINNSNEIQIECKRLRPSMYELRETAKVQEMFHELSSVIHAERLSVHINVNFLQSLPSVDRTYLAEKVQNAANSTLVLPDGYPWKDEVAEGVVRDADLDAVRADIQDTYLLFGPKLARLLSRRIVREGSYLMAIQARPNSSDPRYIDTIDYGSVVTWQCEAEESIEARARHVKSKLAEIDRQLENASYGIAHIGMDAERDPQTADLRRAKNLDAVRYFKPNSAMREVHLHYYLPRVAETAAWMIDETVDSNSISGAGLLEDARILTGEEPDIDTHVPAWHLPPPPTPDAT